MAMQEASIDCMTPVNHNHLACCSLGRRTPQNSSLKFTPVQSESPNPFKSFS